MTLVASLGSPGVVAAVCDGVAGAIEFGPEVGPLGVSAGTDAEEQLAAKHATRTGPKAHPPRFATTEIAACPNRLWLATVVDTQGGAARDLRVHRGLLQPGAPPFASRTRQP